MQISNTQVLKNSSALLLPPPSSPLFPSIWAPAPSPSFLSSIFFHSFQASLLPISPPHLVSFVFRPICPTCLSTFPYYLWPSLLSWPGCGWTDRAWTLPTLGRQELQWGDIILRNSKVPWILGFLCRSYGDGRVVAMLWALDPHCQDSSPSSACWWCDLGQVMKPLWVLVPSSVESQQ